MSAELDGFARMELADLAARYAAAVDSREWERLAALFTADAVLIGPDVPRSLAPVLDSRGREAIVATMHQLTAFASTFHHVTGSYWTANGRNGALGRTTTIAHHVEAPPPGTEETRSWVWHVVYEDRCTRTEAGWQFERRALTVKMVEARPIARALAFEPPPDS
jgi:hypothetical protein